MHYKHVESRSLFKPLVATLPSGIRVALDYVPTVDSFSLGIWVHAGTRDEPSTRAGVAHVVEHTAFRRTVTRSNRRIAREFENVGAYANAFTTKEETCYYLRALSDHCDRVLPVLADVVLHPEFRESDVAKERAIIAEEIRSYEDEPDEYILDLAEQQQFGSHALGVPIVGTVESVQNITAKDVQSFHAHNYHSHGIVVAASGNLDWDTFLQLVDRCMSDVMIKKSSLHRSPPRATRTTEIRQHHSTQQAHLVWHVRTKGNHSRQRSALTLLNVLLGDGMTSRLNVRLRENAGLAYTITSQLQLFSDAGMLLVYAATDARKEGKAALMIERELTTLATNGISAAELRRAKEQVRASRIMSLESLSSRMNMVGKGLLEDGKPEDPFKAIHDVMSVTIEEMNSLARSLCDTSRWHRITLIPFEA